MRGMRGMKGMGSVRERTGREESNIPLIPFIPFIPLPRKQETPPKRGLSTSQYRIRQPAATTLTVRRFFGPRSEEHTSELQSLMRISYAVFCLKKKKSQTHQLQ